MELLAIRLAAGVEVVLLAARLAIGLEADGEELAEEGACGRSRAWRPLSVWCAHGSEEEHLDGEEEHLEEGGSCEAQARSR